MGSPTQTSSPHPGERKQNKNCVHHRSRMWSMAELAEVRTPEANGPGLNLSFFSPLCVCVCQWFSRVQLCGPMDCSPPGSSVQGILEASLLEWVAISFSRGSSWGSPGIEPTSPALQADSLLSEPLGKPPQFSGIIKIQLLRKLRHTTPLPQASICQSREAQMGGFRLWKIIFHNTPKCPQKFSSNFILASEWH